MTTGDDQLAERMDALGEKIDGLAEALREETEARQDENASTRELFRRSTRNLRVGLAAFVVALLAIGGGFLYLRAETNRRCDQVQRVTDAVSGIVGITARPNPNRTPEQQAAIDEFLKSANTLLDEARAC